MHPPRDAGRHRFHLELEQADATQTSDVKGKFPRRAMLLFNQYALHRKAILAR